MLWGFLVHPPPLCGFLHWFNNPWYGVSICVNYMAYMYTVQDETPSKSTIPCFSTNKLLGSLVRLQNETFLKLKYITFLRNENILQFIHWLFCHLTSCTLSMNELSCLGTGDIADQESKLCRFKLVRDRPYTRSSCNAFCKRPCRSLRSFQHVIYPTVGVSVAILLCLHKCKVILTFHWKDQNPKFPHNTDIFCSSARYRTTNQV